MPRIPSRRWLQFSMRTLLVAIALVSSIAAHHAKWMHDRTGVLKRTSHLGGVTRAPGLLGIAGVVGYKEIDVIFEPNEMTAARERARVAALFPEAEAINAYGIHLK